MPNCEFEEKEYETQMTIELARPPTGRRYLAAAGQHLEKLLGYDAAVDPTGADPVWRAMKVSRPAGVRLLPTMFGAAPAEQPAKERLPAQPVTLLLQFKRPYHVAQRRGPSPPDGVPVPVYRVEVSSEQQSVLRRLETKLTGQALVRYAAPVFHTVAELEAARVRARAVERSSYVAPSVIDVHSYWYYVDSGTAGWANPEPEELPLEDAAALFAALEHATRASVAEVPGLAGHLRALADAVRSTDSTAELLVDRWMVAVRAAVPDLEPGQLERLRQLASISTFISRQQLTWLLLGEGVDGEPVAEPERRG